MDSCKDNKEIRRLLHSVHICPMINFSSVLIGKIERISDFFLLYSQLTGLKNLSYDKKTDPVILVQY